MGYYDFCEDMAHARSLRRLFWKRLGGGRTRKEKRSGDKQCSVCRRWFAGEMGLRQHQKAKGHERID